MSKALEDLTFAEMRRELKLRQMDSKGSREELQDRLQSWIMDQGEDPEDYLFVDPFQKMFLMGFESIKSEFNNLSNKWEVMEDKLAVVIEKVTEVSFDGTATRYQLGKTPAGTKNIMPAEASAVHPIASLVSVEKETEEIVNGRTLGSEVFLPWSEESGKELRKELGEENGVEETFVDVSEGSLGVDEDSPIVELLIKMGNVENKDSGELRESFASSKEVAPVPDEPVQCTIASLVSVVERTEEIIEGGTLGETRVEPPRVEESVEELGPENSGDRFELGVSEFDSAVDIVEAGAADVIVAERGDIGGEILGVREYMVDKVGSMSETFICGVLSQSGLSGLRRSSETRGEHLVLLVVLLIFFSKRFSRDARGGRARIETVVVRGHHVRDCVPRVKMKVAPIRRLAKYHEEQQSVRDEQI